MKQMLHIFAKDSRQFWPEIVISLALVVTFVWIYPRSWLSGNTLYAVAGGAFVPALFEEYLGGMKWYLDLVFGLNEHGIEILGPPQRFVIDANWKSGSARVSCWLQDER